MRQEREPPQSTVSEVAPGVRRVQLPVWLPGLGHVNMYVLEDRRGAVVVDPGMPGSWRPIRRGLAHAGIPVRRVHTIVVTHSHPDHFGGAPRLMRRSGADLVTHESFSVWWKPAHPVDPLARPGSRPYARVLAGELPWQAPRSSPPGRRWRRHALRILASRTSVPTPTRPVGDGDRLDLGGREWLVIHTPGHTEDHLCLHCPETGTLITGDHVLPTITPHVSGLGGGDPLGRYLASLRRTRSLVGVTRVLPAHGHPFSDLQHRITEIERHHRDRLDRLARASAALGPATVADLSRSILPRAYWGFMGESETYAHLEHLRRNGRAERREEGGRVFYTVATAGGGEPPGEPSLT